VDLVFPEEVWQNTRKDIIQEVLAGKEIIIFVSDFILKEDDKKENTFISCVLNLKNENIFIEGKGQGILDALFNSILKEVNKSFYSLGNVELEDFSVRVKFKESFRWSKMDAPVEITLVLKNSSHAKMYFRAQSRSLVRAIITVTCSSLEYLVNAELAVIQLMKDIRLAEKRNRHDLIGKYTAQMAKLVEIANYENTLKIWSLNDCDSESI